MARGVQTKYRYFKMISQEKLISAYSKERIKAYKISANNMTNLANYYWDIELSEAFYPVLRTVEVVLRNKLWLAISMKTNNKNWLSLKSVLCSQEQEMIINLQSKLKINNARWQDTDHLVSELSFGFWVNLLNKRYEQILWPHLLKIVFPNIARKNCTRKFIHSRFKAIRDLRNRIFHHQRIYHFPNLKSQHQSLLEAIGWLEPMLLEHLKIIDRFEQIYEKDRSFIRQRLQDLESR